MEYNIPTNYKDTTPSAPLDKKTLNKMVWRSLFLQASFNYERMQAGGWLYGILPGLQKIHTDKDDLAASMSHNLEFFNTHPFLVTFVMGIILSLEQSKADIQTIRSVRVAAMGPLGGIGDALFWFTLVPIVAGMTSNMALQGQIAAPFIFLIVFNIAQFAVRYGLMHWSYKMGTNAIGILTANAKEFTRAASILGVIVVGALTCIYGTTTTKLEIPNGVTNEPVEVVTVVPNEALPNYEQFLYAPDETTNQIPANVEDRTLLEGAEVADLGNGNSQITFNRNQEVPVTIKVQEILDGIIPNMIPLAITLLLYGLFTKRKWTPLKGIALILVIGLVGAFFGVF
ncbi:MAG: PTS system mannose/fructose/sorbose family transporter subunit IID [Gallicola sp.]|uniref:PTS system mannose/fructose/sorbose family transporter subunit IID n=1 Tax=Gallicola sp. Sow4_E12 TaxID=3438785 RepID=UPI0017E380C7|nr:PTS system mannose/fructose/sorbose family transporter subunit IID [Gallicola sp.]